VRRRILLAIIGVAAVAVLVFAVPLGVTVRNLTIQDELSEIERAAERVGRGVEPEDVRESGVSAMRVAGSEFTIGIYDGTGQRVHGRGPARLEPDLRRSLRGTVTSHRGDPLRVAVPIGVQPTTGAVRAVAPAANVDSRVLRAWLLLGGFALVAVAAAAALAWWLSRRLDAPLQRLADAAHRVGDGDFTTRAPRSGVAEIDSVATAIDTTSERLGNALQRERSFSADVSHQLRTRVAGLRVTLEAASITGSSEHDAIEQAIEETDRLETTINELLALARDTSAPHEAFDVQAALDDLERRWRGPLAADDRPLRVQAEPGLPRPGASPAATRQILDVLLDNALRHGRGEVRVTARATRDAVAIDVADQGPGIPPGRADPFERRPDGASGHGIGLALAQSLAEAEGGRLVLARRAPGAEFTLLMPIPAADA
jgi:signal transduction histidine kinase